MPFLGKIGKILGKNPKHTSLLSGLIEVFDQYAGELLEFIEGMTANVKDHSLSPRVVFEEPKDSPCFHQFYKK